jgi:hypothetical protein
MTSVHTAAAIDWGWDDGLFERLTGRNGTSGRQCRAVRTRSPRSASMIRRRAFADLGDLAVEEAAKSARSLRWELMMDDGFHSLHEGVTDPGGQAASRRGYLASAAIVAECDRLRRRLVAPMLSLAVGALVSWLLAMGVVVPAAVAVLAGTMLVVGLSPSGTRLAALDRMVELEPFAVPGAPASVQRAAVRRAHRLRSEPHRRKLAASLIRRANLGCSPPHTVSPAAVGVCMEPDLAHAVAARLLEDGDDPRLAVAVGRLLRNGCGPGDDAQRVRDLLAAS